MAEIVVQGRQRDYSVWLQSGILERAGEKIAALGPGRRALVLCDWNLEKIHLATLVRSLKVAGIDSMSYALEPLEQQKTLQGVEAVYRACRLAELSRQDLLIALGGGVVQDVATFVAATWQHGLKLVLLPTSLSAQATAGLSGRSALHFAGASAQLACFYAPHLVLVDPSVLRTLPRHQLAEGMIELIRYGATHDDRLLEQIERRQYDYEWLIERAIRGQKALYEKDPFEQQEALALQFGQSFARAILAITEHVLYSYGEALAMGLYLALRLGELRGLTPPALRARICALIAQQLPLAQPLDIEALQKQLAFDDKRQGQQLQEIFLEEVGKTCIQRLPLADLAADLGQIWPDFDAEVTREAE